MAPLFCYNEYHLLPGPGRSKTQFKTEVLNCFKPSLKQLIAALV